MIDQQRLCELVRDDGTEVRVICSHDPRELEAIAGRQLDARAPAHAVRAPPRATWPAG